jgi:predicted permease
MLGRFFRRRRWDRERALELDAYLETETQDNIARGMTLDDARSAARRKLGNPTLVREEIYRMNTAGIVDALWRGLKYALRQWRRSPGFAAAAVLSLALGIGANTAIFTVLDQVLLRLLPVRDPNQLVLLYREGFQNTLDMGNHRVSYPFYRDLRDHNQVFDGVLCRFPLDMSLGYQGQTERIEGELVSGNYFEVLGVGAALGRTFTRDDDRLAGGHPLAVLSYDFWVDRFHADPGVLGKTILVNDHVLSIIGVSARGFDGVELGYSPKVRVPVAMKKEMTGFFSNWDLTNRRTSWAQVYARLKPGITAEQAQASLQPLFHSILESEAAESKKLLGYNREQFFKGGLVAQPASQGLSSMRLQYATPLKVLMAIVGLVLLMACANVANLLIARSAARQRETAVRLAIGAGREHLIRQSLVESAVLALAGGALGLLLAMWSARALVGFLPSGDTELNLRTTPDLRILGFTLVVCAVTALLFGLAPAVTSGGADLLGALREKTSSGGSARLRRGLVAAQVFLAVLLLASAGLFVRSLTNLRQLDPGFHTDHVVAFSVRAMDNGYRKERSVRFYHDLMERLRAVPGVDRAAFANVPLLDGDWHTYAGVEGYEEKPGEDMKQYFNMVSPGYFETLGIPLVEGRDFAEADVGREGVAIVNRAFVHRYFGNQSPIGRHLKLFESGSMAHPAIIGVVADTKYLDMREDHPRQVFLDFHQHDDPTGGTAYVKTRLDSKQMFAALRAMVRGLDPNVPVFEMRTLDEQVERNLATERLVASLATVFGAMAGVLAAVGLYGLMAFNVTRRTREIGVRVALGASRTQVTWLAIREVLALAAVGAALALPAAWGLAHFIESQLYGVKAGDPLALGGAFAALALVAIAASYVPARRAAKLAPMVALREE